MVRALYSDAVDRVACPHCGRAPGSRCTYPTGEKRTEPHADRIKALYALTDFNEQDYQVPLTRLGDLLPGLVPKK